jgi:hypothetical protein
MFWSQIKCLIILIVDDVHLLSADDSDADKDYMPDNNSNNNDSHSVKLFIK